MKHYVPAQTEAVDQVARIVTVGMGTLGGMVVRQLLRTVSNAECVLLQSRDDVVHDLPALGKLVCGADCVFIVVNPLDEEALNTANWLARVMKGEGALVAILTDESVESSNVATPSDAFSHSSRFCLCIVVSPLSVNPLSEDVLSMFGREMIAAYHIRHVIEIVIRMMTEKSIICVDYADIKQIIECGGTLRLGVGMSTNGNAGDAAQKALESLALQGVDVSTCRGMLGCLTGSTNLSMNNFDTICKALHESLDEEASWVMGMLTDDALGRTSKVTLLAAY